MSETVDTPKAGWRMKVAAFSLCVSIFTVIWFAVAALGTKWGWWPWQVGLGQMTMGIGFPLAVLSLGVALVAQIISLIKFPRKQAFIIALAATLISFSVAGRLYFGFLKQAAAVPPIHDIQTDWSDPVRYSEAIMSARTAQGETNPVLDAPKVPEGADARWPGTGGRLVSELQEEAEAKEGAKGTVYPRLEPLYFDQDPAEIAALAETIMAKKGWEIVTPANESGADQQVEATATSGWFGFKDDIAVRVRPEGDGTRLDIRSTSRVGLSDLGANSKRVYGLLVELQDRGDGRFGS